MAQLAPMHKKTEARVGSPNITRKLHLSYYQLERFWVSGNHTCIPVF